MSLKHGVIGLCLTLALPLAALAHDPGAVPDDPELLRQYQAGFQAYQQSDYATALDKWLPLAESGSSAAQLFIGFMHASGQGVPKDDTAAATWYRKAAERNNAIAQVRLAIAYRDGRGVPADRVQALFWASMAGRETGHVQKIAMALQNGLKPGMTAAEIGESEHLFHTQTDTH